MKQHFSKRNNFIEEEVQLLQQQGFPRKKAEVMALRGVTANNYQEFFDDNNLFHDPFEMVNMREACETLTYVMEGGGSVLIYGDYDADGLTASAILSLFLTDNGVDHDVVIPTRNEGYGLHVENIAKAFEKKYYDLVVTVDCGISNKAEIDEILQRYDTEIIVTDHHELPEELPNCLCVNPKMGYPFAMLAGAGVAWKLVEGIVGRETALGYAFLASIGTIADIMPLVDENRSLVKAGLSNVNHKSLLKLAELSKVTFPVSAVDVSMKIAPKINAAGRVGEPLSALEVLLQRDKCDVKTVERLLELNDKRKEQCDVMISQAQNVSDTKTQMHERMVFLTSETWQHGLLGIVASRFKEESGLPTMVLTRDGDNYVGSARGTDGVNLFDAFCSVKDLLVKFGGHKSSVGFTVSKDNLTALRSSLAQYFNSLPAESFENITYYDIDVEENDSLTDLYTFAESFAPFLPQDQVLFRLRANVKYASLFGKDKNHLSITMDNGLELKGFFNFAKYERFLNGAEIDVLFALGVDSYTNNVYGIIEELQLCNSLCFDELYRENYVRLLGSEAVINCDNAYALLRGKSVLAVFDDFATFLQVSQNYDFGDFGLDFFVRCTTFNKTVVIAPERTYPFERFENIVVFTASNLQYSIGGNVHYVKVTPADEALYSLKLNRDICVTVYKALRSKQKFESVKGVYNKYLATTITYAQFVASLRVFCELSLVKIVDEYTVELPSSEKIALENSVLFNVFTK